MKARIVHENIHVLDLDKSLEFYEEALGMTEARRIKGDDWQIVFIDNDESDFQIELTWNEGRTEPYNNGGRDTHMAFRVDDYDAFYKLHEEMGCICFVNEKMGLYFIEDPDGCWIEIINGDKKVD